jgi:UDP-N-acetylmuramoyl-tripeptide--D-alanyl-D-alanine ligase
VFDGVAIDSRSVEPGALFVALKGERFDGHAFVSEAVAGGAGGLVVSDPSVDVAGVPVFHVADTLVALQALGHAVRRQSNARVVAITGSAGKTTTKEMTAQLLSTTYRVFRNKGNLNNHIGLPLSLVDLRRGPDVAVVELGMNHEGEIRTLVDIAEPDVRVWTNVGDAHVGHLGSVDAIARAKAEVLEHATDRTVAVVNADDPLVMRHVHGFPGRTVTFGTSGAAHIHAMDVVDRGFDGTTATVETRSGPLSLTVPLAGQAQLMNVLAAIGVAIEFDVAPRAIESIVAALTPVARRGLITRLSNGARLVDDSYNASPAALRAMLGALRATAVSGRRIAVLGEMLELGDLAADLHAACGQAAVRAGVEELVVIGGPAADGLVAGAIAGGLHRSHVHRFANSQTAALFVADLVAPGDLVLVKGSRGTRTDIVADRLQEVA